MVVTAWNNGKWLPSGGGYGLRIIKADREKFFKSSWKTILIYIEDDLNPVKVNLRLTFWQRCTEVRNMKIGQWLIKKGYKRWEKGKPPEFDLTPLKNNSFKLNLRD